MKTIAIGADRARCASSAGMPALLINLESLAQLVSIGTLFVFLMLSAAVLWRRHCNMTGTNRGLTARMLLLCLTAAGMPFGLNQGLHEMPIVL